MQKTNKSFRIFLMICVTVSIFVLFIFLYKKKYTESTDTRELLTPIEIEQYLLEGISDDNDVDQGASEKDNQLNDYPYRVMVCGIKNIAETMPEDACNLIEPYLSQYIDYYDKTGNKYTADYIPGSFKANTNWPSFNIYLHTATDDIKIRCIYWTAGKYYEFQSSLSETESQQ